MPNVYYSTTRRNDEINVLRATRPRFLLLSFALNGHYEIKELIEDIGYRPEKIMIDPGAVTFRTYGVNTGIWDLLDGFLGEGCTEKDTAQIIKEEIAWWENPPPAYKFFKYVFNNQLYIDQLLTFDAMGSAPPTDYCFRVMMEMELNPIPVFHYQPFHPQNWEYLEWYVQMDCPLIALGGTIVEPKLTKRVEFVKECVRRYPNQRFHLLGSQSEYVLDRVPELYSCDGNKWKLSASYSENRLPGQSKVEKSIEIVKKLENKYTSKMKCE